MKIQYCSDLHLEFKNNLRYLNNFKIKPLGDILILAGDIIELVDGFEKHAFLKYCSDNFKLTLWCPGNHEYYYNSKLNKFGKSCNEKIKDNLYLINNNVFKYEDVNFVLSTLWSDIPEYKKIMFKDLIHDFDIIKYDVDSHYKDLLVTPDILTDLYKYSVDSLKLFFSNLKENEKNIVVTHFAPSRFCNSEFNKSNSINEYFVSNLNDLILDNTEKISHWIYGHTHYNTDSYKIDNLLGNTRMITNQLGYVHHGLNESFSREKIIKV